jgi:hypothetical protein
MLNKMRKPDFLIIGEQKCGTTSLNRMLGKHTNIFTPMREVHFFDTYYNRSTNWYYKHFNDADKKEICGEKTPNYLFFPECLIRIKNTLPDVKLIIMLREPAARAISYYRSNGEIYKKDFTDVMEKGIEIINEVPLLRDYCEYHFIQRGLYYQSIKRCFDYFNQDNIRIIPFEQFIKTPRKYLYMILNFLGVKKKNIPLMRTNTAKRRNKVTTKQKEILKLYYREHNKKLFDLLGYEIKEWR